VNNRDLLGNNVTTTHVDVQCTVICFLEQGTDSDIHTKDVHKAVIKICIKCILTVCSCIWIRICTKNTDGVWLWYGGWYESNSPFFSQKN